MFPACEPDWELMENKGSNGATERPDLETQEECLSTCNADETCFGADIDMRDGNTLCWLFSDEDAVQETFDRNGVNHYILTVRCQG